MATIYVNTLRDTSDSVVTTHAKPDASVAAHASFCRPFVDRGPRLDAIRAWLAPATGLDPRARAASG